MSELTTAAIIEPISNSQLASELTLDSDVATAQATILTSCVKASRAMIENMCGLTMIETTWTQYFDTARCVQMDKYPFLSLTSVDYQAGWAVDTWVNIDSASLIVSPKKRNTRINTRQTPWPVFREMSGLRVVYKTGYGSSNGQTSDANADVIAARALIPGNLQKATLQYAAHLYVHRKGDGSEPRFEAQAMGQKLPRTILVLIEEYLDWRLV